MNYAKIDNDQIVKYPYTIIDLKTDNPNVSFPKSALSISDIREDYSIVEVIPVSAPESETHNVAEVSPVKVSGVWTQTWSESEKTDEEKNSVAVSNRVAEYGTVESQLEFITENGLAAWQTKVSEIKAKYPKV
jgi:hypothetical protein